jgi:transposase
MKWTETTYNRVQHLLPVQRGHVVIDNLTFLQALESMTENGCRWRALPAHFGHWFTIYRRFRRWIDQGIFDRIENYLRSEKIQIKGVQELALDSTYVKVHPDGTGAPKKKGLNRSAPVGRVRPRKFTPLLPTRSCRSLAVSRRVRQETTLKDKN